MSGPKVQGMPGIAANITYISQCTPQLCDMKYATMSYVPNLYANEAYLGIFALFLVIQLIMVCPYRTWSYTAAMFCGLLLECIGYWGRIAMHFNIFMSTPFLINIIGLTIAPVFFTAAIYLTLSRVVTHYGAHNSLLSPRTYTAIFITADIISLVLQSIGGGMANAASTKATSTRGVRVMIGGLGFQVISMVIFTLIVAVFFLNVRKDQVRQKATNWAAGKVDPPTTHVKGYKGFVIAFTIAFSLILIRSIFRVAELAHGFSGKLANEEAPFMIFEGGLMLFATIIMTIWHPGRFMQSEWKKQKNVGKEIDDGLSIGSGSVHNGTGHYPNGRPAMAAYQPSQSEYQQTQSQYQQTQNQYQQTQSQWPMHQVPLK